MEMYMIRNLVKRQYPNKAWSDKVDKMKDDQVIAVYYRTEAAENVKKERQRKEQR